MKGGYQKIETYSWKAQDRDGKIFAGKLEAGSLSEAALQIKQKHSYIIKLEREHTGSLSVLCLNGSEHFTDKQRSIFFQQLYIILNSGIPLLQGIELLEHRMEKKSSRICRQLKEQLYAGKSLSNAMRMQKNFFPELSVILTEAGELSGELTTVLNEIAVYYQKQHEWKNFVWKSAAYPVFLLFASLLVLLFFVLYVLPILGNVYISMNAQPNGFLQLALSVNELLQTYYMQIAVSILLLCSGAIRYRRNLIYWLLKMPGVATVYGLLTEIRFCRLLALLLGSGINITAAVPEAGKVFYDDKRRLQIYLFNRQLQKGMDIGAAARKTQYIFSDITEEFIAVGSATGSLPQMVEEAAGLLERDLQDKLLKFKEILAPVLLLMAAVLTAVIVCAVIGPLFDLFSALPEYE